METPETLTLSGKEYAILRLLGKGKGGYTYLAQRDGARYALKQIHHEPCDYYQFGDKLAAELRDYETLSALDIPIPKLLDVDKGQERLLKELLPGETVYQLVLRGGVEPWHLEQVRALSQALREAGLNIDWFPTNFMCRDGVLYYVDYECNGYMDQWSFENWGVRYWSRTSEFDAYAREHGDL
ncbi:MAG: serine/threonine protein kinase [Clostridiales bacterium]|nr:serine/threonine protein kinase [Clostridiales bacterium]